MKALTSVVFHQLVHKYQPRSPPPHIFQFITDIKNLKIRILPLNLLRPQFCGKRKTRREAEYEILPEKTVDVQMEPKISAKIAACISSLKQAV